MNFGVLVKIEAIKVYKRLAFWVTLICFTGIISIVYGEDFVRARRNPERSFSLPDAWREVLGDNVQISLFFASILLVLLFAAEFSWRTARQNVIDGLSKEQFFLGKLLTIPLVMGPFIAMQLLVGAGLALWDTDFGQLQGALVPGAAISAFGGYVLAFLGYASFVVFLSMAIRNSGPAMGVFFFYIALLEQLLQSALVAISEGLRPATAYYPIAIFNRLFEWVEHDPATYQRVAERAAERGSDPPTLMGFGTLALWAFIWIALFVGGSFVWFRKRDL